MTELEKMRRGEAYCLFDPELSRLRDAARRACNAFNTSEPMEADGTSAILRDLFGSAAGDFFIEVPFRCFYGFNIHMGRNAFINVNGVLIDTAPIRLGDDSMIGPGTVLACTDHDRDPQRRAAGMEWGKPITVGARAWIGANVTVLPGITIGADAIVGSGSLVSRDIPDGVVAFGNPARVAGPAVKPASSDI
ncbi:sugar O-acetyltransferase [Hwanghaeella grinnelliae]|uniref:Acetyltransferase n=1 Tax=Hwanghaeella grinnelliae TaxID=2500179 RepID=A0A437QTN5_9PROT|nr:sugar O-acetyltransferase [Hwanghaeella grinnelliae]RVU37871.1 sugar O-acetyltransferase [Hwanghaeella grinnelliae]